MREVTLRSVHPVAHPRVPREAIRAALPRALSPELATLVDAVPADPSAWLFEIKFDGYRLLARVGARKVTLLTRNGIDWSARFPALTKEIRRLNLPAGWYDGEVVALNEKGVPDFGRLQAAFEESQARDAVLYLFDLPFHRGFDLREAPLSARRALLRELLSGHESKSVRFSAEFKADPASILTSACRLGLEGVIGKRVDSRYVSRRSADWIKLKCGKRQEFVVGGYTEPEGSREVLGSLLLGVYEKGGQLRYAGNVGAGFAASTLRSLAAPLKRLATGRQPFQDGVRISGRPHWLRPKLVAEVSFSEWTRDGRLRHPVFHGLRKDKDPRSIRREESNGENAVMKKVAPGRIARGKSSTAPPITRVTVTHGERVIDASSGVSKGRLFAYYEAVAPLLLPHLRERPVSLVRAPGGLAGPKFFQKHAASATLAGVSQLDARLDPDNPPMLRVDGQEGILSAAQWNVIEFHTQNATAQDYERPDRVVFDLDPGERVGWAVIRDGARLLNALLEQLGLTGFLKTSGGKGLHLVVPLRPRVSWDEAKTMAAAVTAHMARTIPDRFVQKSGANNRRGKIFIDYLRNGRGATTVAAWSARARPGLGVSVPLRWEELAGVKSADQWTIANVARRMKIGNTPWDGYAATAADPRGAIHKLAELAPEAGDTVASRRRRRSRGRPAR